MEEKLSVFKNLLGLGGIYFFFLAEKLVSTISDYRTEKAAEKVRYENLQTFYFNGLHISL